MNTPERAIAAMPSITLNSPSIPSSTAAKTTSPYPSPRLAPLARFIVADVILASRSQSPEPLTPTLPGRRRMSSPTHGLIRPLHGGRRPDTTPGAGAPGAAGRPPPGPPRGAAPHARGTVG